MKTLILAGVALIALLGLAATLNSLVLDPGTKLPLSDLAPTVSDGGGESDIGNFLLAAFRVVMILAWVFVPVYVIILLINKDERKRFLRNLLIYGPIFILLYLLSTSRMTAGLVQEIVPQDFTAGEIEIGESEPLAPLPEYEPPAPWVTTAATAAIAAALAAAAAGIGFMLYQRSRSNAAEPLRKIEREAQEALDALEAGGNLSEVILRCYMQMVAALRDLRGIHRDTYMTPHEFEQYLAGRGLPAQAVHQLTALFEQVRYGGVQPGRQEERQAVSSLSAIIAAIQRSRGEA